MYSEKIDTQPITTLANPDAIKIECIAIHLSSPVSKEKIIYMEHGQNNGPLKIEAWNSSKHLGGKKRLTVQLFWALSITFATKILMALVPANPHS